MFIKIVARCKICDVKVIGFIKCIKHIYYHHKRHELVHEKDSILEPNRGEK